LEAVLEIAKRKKGFAILTITLLLCMASLAFTANMASTQLLDNQIAGNCFRNKEAFVNAESGVNFILSKLDTVDAARALLSSLPFNYTSTSNHYTVNVTQDYNGRLNIVSEGKSNDNSAIRIVQLKVNYALEFDVPESPISSNGKLNLDSTATLNDGCEGVTKDNCISKGNISDNILTSNPGLETEQTDNCTGPTIGSNIIDSNAFYGNADPERIIDNGGHWGDLTIQDTSSYLGGITPDKTLTPDSLFEKTFGVKRTDSAINTIKNSAFVIDMSINGAESCSEQLKNRSDENDIIYIIGDCNIDQNDASHRLASENKRFTIGSLEHPKMVFIEGGTFTTQPNTGASIIGILYFIPDKITTQNTEGNDVLTDRQSIDMGGIRVNGAVLTEYNCSHNGSDKTDEIGVKQHFSSRFDRTVLNNLYSAMGMSASTSSYRLVSGTWRDY
jgi:hypothetical protein